MLWPLLKTSVRETMLPALMNQRASGSEAPAGRPSVTGTSNDGEWLQLQHPPGAGLHPLLHPPGAGLHPLLVSPTMESGFNSSTLQGPGCCVRCCTRQGPGVSTHV